MAKRGTIASQCRELRDSLTQAGYSDCDELILRLYILARRGVQEAQTAWSLARSCLSLAQAVYCDITSIQASNELNSLLALQVNSLLEAAGRQEVMPGDLYEGLAVRKKQQGIFYTPPEVIEFILTNTIQKADIVADPWIRILDPACGCGNFLLKAYDVLAEKFSNFRNELKRRYPDLDWSDCGVHRHIVTYNLWGAELDALAADITSASILLKRPDCHLKQQPNIIICDSLYYRSANSNPAHREFWSQTYHFVIGNPPYVSFGLRGVGKLEQEYREFLRKGYQASAEYKLSYYVLFMELGIERLHEGGRLGFIVPDSFLLGRYYSKIRRYILENTAIEILAHIDQPVFKQVTAGFSIICILRKKTASQVNTAAEKIKVYHVPDKASLKTGLPAHRMDSHYFSTLPHQRFRLFFDLTAEKLVGKIDHIGQPLHCYAKGHTGMRSLTRQEDIVSTVCHGEHWRKGLISGSQIHRYGLQYQGHWLHVHPELLYKGGWNQNIVTSRKMLVRQTGFNLTACIDAEGYYHLNNIHSFVLINSVLTLDYVALLFNSRLFSFYYHVISMEAGRSMAQTDIETLEQLPVCENREINQQANQIIALLEAYYRQATQGDNQAAKRFNALDREVDWLVYRLYELTEQEIQYIEQYEQRLQAQRTLQ